MLTSTPTSPQPSIEFPDQEHLRADLPEPDVQILTSGGRRIRAYSSFLALSSPVLERELNRKAGKVIPILGVPCDAVAAFLHSLYASRCDEDKMDQYGIHLLALSHVYSVRQLKQRCTEALAGRLTIDNVVDVLQLARLCDAPSLSLKCMKLVADKFKAVEKTEGWKFLQKHDPWLELDILQYMDEAESRKKRFKRQKEEQSLYLGLNEAMECLVHICTEGCTTVGPYDREVGRKRQPCSKFSTCQGLQLLFRHFAVCKKRVSGGCFRCKRMWQLLRLHASMCDQTDVCKVPLCRQFKLKMVHEKKGGNAKWRLLVRKVLSAKAMSSLSPLKRSGEAVPGKISVNYVEATVGLQ